MVAETHSAYADLTTADVVDYVLNTIAGLDRDAEAGATTTLSDCGIETGPEVLELAEMVGEEYGERTLVGIDIDDIDSSWTVTEFVTTLYPQLPSGINDDD